MYVCTVAKWKQVQLDSSPVAKLCHNAQCTHLYWSLLLSKGVGCTCALSNVSIDQMKSTIFYEINSAFVCLATLLVHFCWPSCYLAASSSWLAEGTGCQVWFPGLSSNQGGLFCVYQQMWWLSLHQCDHIGLLENTSHCITHTNMRMHAHTYIYSVRGRWRSI